MLKYKAIDNNKKEWVVFVHGIGGSTRTWKKQVELFSTRYNLLLLDLPGHGEDSDKIVYKVDTEKLNQGICDTMDHLNINKAHFVGLSLGTIVISNFAVENPNRIKSIILGGSVLNIRGIYKLCVKFANKIKRVVPYKFLYKFFAWFMMPRKNHKLSRNIFLREVIKLNKETMFAWINYLADSIHNTSLYKQLEDGGKKILFISGDEDHCFLKGSKMLAENIKCAAIRIIKNCGHVCSIEKHAIFNKYAFNHLATNVGN